MEVNLKKLATRDDLEKLEQKIDSRLNLLIQNSEKLAQIIRLLDKQEEYLKQNIAALGQKLEMMQEQLDNTRVLVSKISIVQSKIES